MINSNSKEKKKAKEEKSFTDRIKKILNSFIDHIKNLKKDIK